jgi:hypothetical protein
MESARFAHGLPKGKSRRDEGHPWPEANVIHAMENFFHAMENFSPFFHAVENFFHAMETFFHAVETPPCTPRPSPRPRSPLEIG